MAKDDNKTTARQLLDELLAERAEIDQLINALQKRLGNAQSNETTPSTQPEFSLSIQKGEFFGMSRPQAAAAVLRKARRPLSTNEIHDMLIESGHDIPVKNAFNILYTALSRNPEVRKVASNTWGLKEWYPHLKDKDVKKKNGNTADLSNGSESASAIVGTEENAKGEQ